MLRVCVSLIVLLGVLGGTGTETVIIRSILEMSRSGVISFPGDYV